MYSIEKTLVTENRTTTTIADGTYIVKDLVLRWDDVLVILTDTDREGNFALTLTNYPELSNYTGTLEEFILNMDLAIYTPQPYVHAEARSYVQTHDVLRENWIVKGANVTDHIDTIDDATIVKKDLLLRKDGVNYLDNSHLLVSVNGLVHPVSIGNEGIYVLGGMRNFNALKQTDLTFIDFSKVGGLTYLPIDDTSILKGNLGETLYTDGVNIKIPPGQENKTLLVCIAGHLLLLSEVVYYVDKDIIKIELNKLNLELIVLENYKALGLESLVGGTAKVIKPSTFRRDENILKVLNQLNTFIVAVDTPKLMKEVKCLASEHLAGIYSTSKPIHGIAHYSDYHIADYIQEEQDGRFCIKVPLKDMERYFFNVTDWEEQNIIDLTHKKIDVTCLPYLYVTDLYKLN